MVPHPKIVLSPIFLFPERNSHSVCSLVLLLFALLFSPFRVEAQLSAIPLADLNQSSLDLGISYRDVAADGNSAVVKWDQGLLRYDRGSGASHIVISDRFHGLAVDRYGILAVELDVDQQGFSLFRYDFSSNVLSPLQYFSSAKSPMIYGTPEYSLVIFEVANQSNVYEVWRINNLTVAPLPNVRGNASIQRYGDELYIWKDSRIYTSNGAAVGSREFPNVSSSAGAYYIDNSSAGGSEIRERASGNIAEFTFPYISDAFRRCRLSYITPNSSISRYLGGYLWRSASGSVSYWNGRDATGTQLQNIPCNANIDQQRFTVWPDTSSVGRVTQLNTPFFLDRTRGVGAVYRGANGITASFIPNLMNRYRNFYEGIQTIRNSKFIAGDDLNTGDRVYLKLINGTGVSSPATSIKIRVPGTVSFYHQDEGLAKVGLSGFYTGRDFNGWSSLYDNTQRLTDLIPSHNGNQFNVGSFPTLHENVDDGILLSYFSTSNGQQSAVMDFQGNIAQNLGFDLRYDSTIIKSEGALYIQGPSYPQPAKILRLSSAHQPLQMLAQSQNALELIGVHQGAVVYVDGAELKLRDASGNVHQLAQLSFPSPDLNDDAIDTTEGLYFDFDDDLWFSDGTPSGSRLIASSNYGYDIEYFIAGDKLAWIESRELKYLDAHDVPQTIMQNVSEAIQWGSQVFFSDSQSFFRFDGVVVTSLPSLPAAFGESVVIEGDLYRTKFQPTPALGVFDFKTLAESTVATPTLPYGVDGVPLTSASSAIQGYEPGIVTQGGLQLLLDLTDLQSGYPQLSSYSGTYDGAQQVKGGLFISADGGLTGGEPWRIDGLAFVDHREDLAIELGAPVLRSTRPVLGTTVTLKVDNLQAGEQIVTAIGTVQNSPTVIGPIRDWVGLGTAILVGPVAATGQRETINLPLPNDPTLVGANLAVQVFVIDATGSIRSSNPLTWIANTN
ncbi:hypothetical protein MRY87_02845 [bacterium]|nr:hypothetical protein [bacterium]